MNNPGDLHAVRVFAAVVETGSFQAAARRLGLPRSTVSARVAQLEARLGVRLLARTTRRVSVTDAGRSYHDQIRPALATLDDADRRIAGLGEVPRGKVRVSTSHGFGASFVSDIAARLLHRHPEVQLVVDLSDRMVDLVGEGFDVAIRGGELADSSLSARPLGGARLRCYAAPSYLEARPAPVHPRDLADHAALLASGDTSAEWRFDGPERLAVKVQGRYSINAQRLLAEAAERGLGVARLFPHLAGPLVDRGSLVPLLPEWPSPESKLHLVTPGTRLRTAAVRAFLDTVDEVLSEQLAR